VHCSLIQ